jgi:hypothetical protein
MPTPTPFKDLAGYMDKQTIACVEGQITKIQEKVARGTSQYGDWAMQFSTLRDAAGAYHDVTITDEASFFTNESKGATIRLESQPQSKGGPAGVSMGVRFKDNKENRSIKVDNRALVTLLNGALPSGGGQSAATQGGVVSAQSGGIPSGFDYSPVRERVHGLLEVMKEFSAQYKHLQSTAEEGTVPKLTASDILTGSIHIYQTYRGDLGSYAKPIFLKPQAEKPKEETWQQEGGVEDDGDPLPF